MATKMKFDTYKNATQPLIYGADLKQLKFKKDSDGEDNVLLCFNNNDASVYAIVGDQEFFGGSVFSRNKSCALSRRSIDPMLVVRFPYARNENIQNAKVLISTLTGKRPLNSISAVNLIIKQAANASLNSNHMLISNFLLDILQHGFRYDDESLCPIEIYVPTNKKLKRIYFRALYLDIKCFLRNSFCYSLGKFLKLIKPLKEFRKTISTSRFL